MIPCPDCGVLLKSAASLGGHYSQAHGRAQTTEACPRRDCSCDLCRTWSRTRARSRRRAVSQQPWRIVTPRPDWFGEAACKGHDPSLWHPDGWTNQREAAQAIAICRGCPVRTDCLEHALEQDEALGIWGGTQPGERHRIAAYRARSEAAL